MAEIKKQTWGLFQSDGRQLVRCREPYGRPIQSLFVGD